MLAIGLSYMSFIMLRYIPSMPTFWRVFIMNGCWIWLKKIWDVLKWSYGFYFKFVDVVYYIDWFADVEKPLHPWLQPGMNSTWSWSFKYIVVYGLLVFGWGVLHLCSSVILACEFLFLRYLRVLLVSGWWWAHTMSLEVFFLLQFLE